MSSSPTPVWAADQEDTAGTADREPQVTMTALYFVILLLIDLF